MTSTTAHIPFTQRSSTHPLSAYLFRLMLVKSSNLCLSADVTSASALLSLANSIGPSIVILKTHFDIVADWDSHPTRGTGACLAALARRHGFLIFEDRKFSDIGSTVQKQYTSGPGAIVEWAHITNAHILPGKAIVEALGDAANLWRQKKRFAVRTRISVGTPRPESFVSEADGTQTPMSNGNDDDATDVAVRKASIVSMTTISQHFEDANAAPARSEATDEEEEGPFQAIEEAPLDRALLLLAQMSSAGNLLDAAYTKACVEIARSNKDFVMGYIAQESLNTEPQDQFLTMTPGCQLPPGDYGEVDGDGKGQQYNTPQKLVGALGCDIIIVGRGIINAADPLAEAERYRSKAWKAYEERVAKDIISEAAKS